MIVASRHTIIILFPLFHLFLLQLKQVTANISNNINKGANNDWLFSREARNNEQVKKSPKNNSSSEWKGGKNIEHQSYNGNYREYNGQGYDEMQQYDDTSTLYPSSSAYKPVGSEYRLPIDYEFQLKDKTSNSQRRTRGMNRDTVEENSRTRMSNSEILKYETDDGPNARRDAISQYMRTFKGRLLLRASSGVVGLTFGAFIGKSILNTPLILAIILSSYLVFLTYFRGPYGELSKALGLTMIYVWQRNFRIRRQYPTWPHVKASLGMRPRRPFPRNDDFSSREVSFYYTLAAMGMVGSTVGGSLPLIPTWIGALCGAGLFVFSSTLKSSSGDLCRSMGMRIVAVAEELLDINQELRVVQKSGVAAGLILDKLLILDRKHKIKDRIATGLSWAYYQIARTAGQVDRPRREKNSDDNREYDENQESQLHGMGKNDTRYRRRERFNDMDDYPINNKNKWDRWRNE